MGLRESDQTQACSPYSTTAPRTGTARAAQGSASSSDAHRQEMGSPAPMPTDTNSPYPPCALVRSSALSEATQVTEGTLFISSTKPNADLSRHPQTHPENALPTVWAALSLVMLT